jgi:hypothetical protein
LGILVREAPAGVLEKLSKFGGKIFTASLSQEDESRLMAAFDAATAEFTLKTRALIGQERNGFNAQRKLSNGTRNATSDVPNKRQVFSACT